MLQVAENRDGRAGLAGTRYLTPRERCARGKALRQALARQDHGVWEPPEGRRDPVDGFATPPQNVMLREHFAETEKRFFPVVREMPMGQLWRWITHCFCQKCIVGRAASELSARQER